MLLAQYFIQITFDNLYMYCVILVFQNNSICNYLPDVDFCGEQDLI